MTVKSVTCINLRLLNESFKRTIRDRDLAGLIDGNCSRSSVI